jgi:hypothetical protein
MFDNRLHYAILTPSKQRKETGMQTIIETTLATLCFLFVGAIVAIAFI